MIATILYLVLLYLAEKSLRKKRTEEEILEIDEIYRTRSFISAFFKLNPSISWLLLIVPFIRLPLILLSISARNPFGNNHFEQGIIFFFIILFFHLSLFCFAYTSYSIKNILKKPHSDRFVSKCIFYPLLGVLIASIVFYAFALNEGVISADKLLTTLTIAFFILAITPIIWTIFYNIYKAFSPNISSLSHTSENKHNRAFMVCLPPKVPTRTLDDMTDYEFESFLKNQYGKGIPKDTTLIDNPFSVEDSDVIEDYPQKEDAIENYTLKELKRVLLKHKFIILILLTIIFFVLVYQFCFRYSYGFHNRNYSYGQWQAIPMKTDNLTGKIYWYNSSKEEWFLVFTPNDSSNTSKNH